MLHLCHSIRPPPWFVEEAETEGHVNRLPGPQALMSAGPWKAPEGHKEEEAGWSQGGVFMFRSLLAGRPECPLLSRWLSLRSPLLCVPGALPALLPQAFLLNSSHLLALCLCSNSTSLLYRKHVFSKNCFLNISLKSSNLNMLIFFLLGLVGLSYPCPHGAPLKGPLLSPVLFFSVTSWLIVNPSWEDEKFLFWRLTTQMRLMLLTHLSNVFGDTAETGSILSQD